MSKIIDIERKGNLVRFYLGADDCNDYWGDDWNDAPYEHNAGLVYERFIETTRDIAFPFDSLVLEPANDWSNDSRYSKEDMKHRRVPCLIVVPAEVVGDYSYRDQFKEWIGADGIKKFYFEDPEEVLNNEN